MPKLKHPVTGRIVSVSNAGLGPLRARGYTDPDAPVASSPASSDRPAVSATKAEWVKYAASQGVENPDGFTKAELLDQLGEEQ